MIYFDTSYIARLYFEDPGWEEVRALAATDHIACCLHGRAETLSAFHRKFREGVLEQEELRDLLRQFDRECDAGAFQWLPVSSTVIHRVSRAYGKMPRSTPVRAADAVHLGCAAENGFKEAYSNDRSFLTAAEHFGLRGLNII